MATRRGRGMFPTLVPGIHGFARSGLGTIRGVTVGPIESALHPEKGYGSDAYLRTLGEVRRMGGTWVSLTPFARIADLSPTGIALDFEAPFVENRAAVARGVEQAHRAGLRVLLVPHLWVEDGEWRGLIDPKTDAGWRRWAAAYSDFVARWAEVAAETHADMFSLGVELRSWVTTARAPLFLPIIERVRSIYGGLLTYAANWDDVADTVILGELDVIGVNAFFPLAERDGAGLETLLEGSRKVSADLGALARRLERPIVFTEFGYTTRPNPAVKPWEWPDHMQGVVVDELAQADAYRALLAPLVNAEWFAGFFVWRVYADPDDASQEAEWGFSPRGKLAELVLRDAFSASWAADGRRAVGTALFRHSASGIGWY